MHWGIINNQAVMRFQKIKDAYSLQNHDFHRYLQIRHYMGGVIKKADLDSTLQGVIKIMTEAYQGQIQNKVISKLYWALEDLKYVKETWEREANVVPSREDWGK